MGHNLKPLGIQLTRLETGNKVFTPSTNERTAASKEVNWLYAKILVQNADAIVSLIVGNGYVIVFVIKEIEFKKRKVYENRFSKKD